MTQDRAAPAPGVVTPEAVRLEFAPAGVASRALALIIDLIVLGVVLAALGLAMVLLQAPTSAVTVASAAVLVLVVYPALFETAMRGRTPGKAALGLRVVTREGAPVGLRHAAIRAALGLVDVYASAGGVAVVSVLATRRSQRLGDIVAGTLVLRERSAAGPPRPIIFGVPPGWEPYAATLDPAVLGTRGYQAVRAFLLRAAELRPEVRGQVAREIADPLAARMGHRPPPGVTAELFLLCLAARYQQRAAAPSPAAPPPAVPSPVVPPVPPPGPGAPG